LLSCISHQLTKVSTTIKISVNCNLKKIVLIGNYLLTLRLILLLQSSGNFKTMRMQAPTKLIY